MKKEEFEIDTKKNVEEVEIYYIFNKHSISVQTRRKLSIKKNELWI